MYYTAFEILVVPAVVATVGGMVGGVVFLAMMNAVMILIGRLGCAARSATTAYRVDRTHRIPARRPFVGRGGVIG